MKTVTKYFILAMSAVLSASAWAQVSDIVVGSGSGLPGATGIVVPVTLTVDTDNIAGIDMTVTFTTAAQYSNIAVDCGAQTVSGNIFPSCSIAGNVVTIRLAETAATPWVSGLLANITVDIDANAVPLANDPLVAVVVGASDHEGTDITFPDTTNGTFTVLEGPQPVWSSSPTSQVGLDFGSHTTNTGTHDMNLVVTNAGEAGSLLSGSCFVDYQQSSPVFNLISGDPITDLAVTDPATTATIVVNCDTTDATVTTHGGELTCEHGPGELTTRYPLRCIVTATPEPAFSGTPAGLDSMNIVEQGDPDVSSTLTVNNVGDDGTTLTGECAYSGDTAITVTDGSFSIAKGTPAVVTATCSGATEGSYGGTLSCGPTDPQTWLGNKYAVSCTVGPPGPAVYESDPAPDSTIDMTPVEDAVVGDSIPDQVLVITNNPAEANDRDLVLLSCGSIAPVGAPASAGGIYWTQPLPATTIAPYDTATVTFSCDSTTAGDYSELYSCDYDEDGDGVSDGTASYTVTCGVREPEAEVDESPASESTLNLVVPTGSTAQGSVTLFETLDEGADATLENCYFDSGQYLSLISDTSGVTIPSGGSISVVFEAMESDDGEAYSDVLICNYTDSTGEGVEAYWYIEVTVGVTAIPTLSTWGLITMFLAMLGLGGIFSRRRKLN